MDSSGPYSSGPCKDNPVADRLIKAQTLKGFRDYLPDQMMAREHLIETARTVYRSYGFSPIDTPTLEYAEILLGKGGDESDRQLFRFEDQGGRDVAMRFDLTVPLARFAAQHVQELGTPFKRYHIATVWRGERPQKGRYREFMQCDFDTIGTESNSADIETLLVIHDLFVALGFENFRIHINNRKVLNGLLEKQDLSERSTGVLRALDKLAKIQVDGVISELVDQVGLTAMQAREVLQLTEINGSTSERLEQLDILVAGSETGQRGVDDLRELHQAVSTAGLPADRLLLDVSIARGLDYYTGTIYETFLNDLPTIGSVCSGGRYDNLAELFTRQSLPGVGASLGLDRLLAAMSELEMLPTAATPAPVLVTVFESERLGDYLRIARTLRQAGIATEVYADQKGLGKQLKYADRKGFQLAIIAGSEEFAENSWQIKSLRAEQRSQSTVAESELITTVRQLLEQSL